ncbi:hypothetical protein [Streptomyces sp. LMG1-1-1.1]|uniref:hypothetical protein n=1 Tax=Streptomyces sp. LMG1-1-1.1 TaxID=3135245 RepID=UPI00346539DD
MAAVWANFSRRRYQRLIYTNTARGLAKATAMFERAMGAGVRIVRVLLTASDSTTRERLMGRALGSGLEEEWAHNVRTTRLLDRRAVAGTVQRELLDETDALEQIQQASDEELARARRALIGLRSFYAIYMLHGLFVPDTPGLAAMRARVDARGLGPVLDEVMSQP